ncbi:hypothetical protein [Dyadobacter frigoris]|uniref:Uncharacterized protein n=1 Tax=Dyadobacter frigoris TaxID=2576211 RepID=A0A4U6D0W4_9BACT|nr:hypothetical protein [Dyadobacter frigoris]TKT89681.1 hypothetical protein FDK13_22760 [Dyadobacter frigoris]GLU54101.1 hypothetical protein Dfri01_35620 [Dyadobacter frigoris]
MGALEINTKIVDGYIGLLQNLSPNDKLTLISRLTDSVKMDLSEKKSLFKEAFGAFESEESAEKIVDKIRNSRISTRQIESF